MARCELANEKWKMENDKWKISLFFLAVDD